MHRKLLALSTLVLWSGAAFAAPQLIIVNAKVFTADPARPRAEAVAIEDGRFSAVGDNVDIRAMRGLARASSMPVAGWRRRA